MKGSRRRKAVMHAETIYAQLPNYTFRWHCEIRVQWGEVVLACSKDQDMQNCVLMVIWLSPSLLITTYATPL